MISHFVLRCGSSDKSGGVVCSTPRVHLPRAPRVVGRGFLDGAHDRACAPASLPDAFSADLSKKN